jgi:hypothetical protein
MPSGQVVAAKASRPVDLRPLPPASACAQRDRVGIMTPHVSEVRYLPADADLRATGLLGWVSLLLDGRLRAQGIGVRRTQSGRQTLSFPFRDDGYGKRWHYLFPIDEQTRSSIERQVFEQLGDQVA